MDDLENFILNGDDRDVCFWAAEHIFGVCNSQADIYTSEDTHPRVIEDRVDELGVGEEYATCLYLVIKKSRAIILYRDVTDWMLIRATNRARILAAAQAMGLKYQQKEKVND